MTPISSMKAEIFSTEIIKPSSSSPNNHPRIHNLSFFDQMGPHIYEPLLFLYNGTNAETDQQKSYLLKNSLSTALSRYYPLAGKLRDNFVVDCNDDGVVFHEATIRFRLSQLLMIGPDQKEIFRLLIPENIGYSDSIPNGPIIVQVTYFKCGGLSIGLCLCHKVMDMSSMCSFINDWASIARMSDRKICPKFDISSLYPALDLLFLKEKQLIPPEVIDCALMRLVFDGKSIARMKAMVEDLVPKPTRGEVVTAFLYKSVVSAAAKASSNGFIKPSVMNNAVNLRTIVRPPLSERNIGNMTWIFPVSSRADAKVELGDSLREYRKSKTQTFNSFINTTSNKEELYPSLMRGFQPSNIEYEMYSCSNCCSFPFYEVDFGWGKPLWLAIQSLKNGIVLMNSKGGDGIDVFMSLDEIVMDVFKQDEELLSFCIINPSAMGLEDCL